MADFKSLNGYNVKDEQARQNIANILNSIEGINADIDSIDTRTGNVETSIEGINTNIGSIETEIETINDNGVICIGDSYGAGAVPGGTVESWIDNFKNYIGYNSTNFFSNAYGGTGFYATADNKNFLTLLEELENTILDKTKIKRIYVLGGYNDQVYSIAQINQGITEFMTYAKTNYPNAKVYIGCVGYDSRITQSGTREALFIKAINSYKRVIENGGCYLHNIEYILHNPLFMSSDSIHPNADGQKRLARYLVSNFNGTEHNDIEMYLANGKIDCTRYNLTVQNTQDSYIEIGKLVNNNVTTYAVKMECNFTNPTNIPATAYTLSNLQDITNDKFNQAQFCTGSLNKVVKTRIVSNSNFYDYEGILEFDGTNLTIRFYQPISDVQAILIPYQEFELPTILC